MLAPNFCDQISDYIFQLDRRSSHTMLEASPGTFVTASAFPIIPVDVSIGKITARLDFCKTTAIIDPSLLKLNCRGKLPPEGPVEWSTGFVKVEAESLREEMTR